METNLIEQYVINQIDEKTKENETLKAKVAELEKQILVLKGAQDDGQPLDMQVPALGFSYDIETYRYRIEDDNIEEYKKALSKKDFVFLENHDYNITISSYNYILRVQGCCFKLDIGFIAGKAKVCAYEEGQYKTREEAESALLEQLSKDIAHYEAKKEVNQE